MRHIKITEASKQSASLGTDDPEKIKALQASIAIKFERIWRALSQDAPITPTREQEVALSGRLYLAWSDSESHFRTLAMEQRDGWQDA